MKKAVMFVVHLLGFIWNMPLTLTSGFFAMIYEPLDVFWKDWAIHIRVRRILPKWAAGQTIGNVVFYSKLRIEESIKEAGTYRIRNLVNHELRHVRQGQVLGVFFLLAYPIASLIALIKGQHGYRDNWFEKDARRYARRVTE